MKHRFSKRDDNHDEIRDAFIQCGWTWIDTYQHRGIGFDGMIVRHASPVYCIEIKDGHKTPSERKLSDAEEKAKNILGDYWQLIESVEDVLRFNSEH